MNQTVCARLNTFLEPIPEVVAAWLGGSAATRFTDKYSDLDYLILCDDKAVESLIKQVDTFIDHQFGIDRRFRVPEPAWHGFSQVFYRIQNTPEYYYLDISFLRRSLQDKFTDIARHGIAQIQFRKAEQLVMENESSDAAYRRAQSMYHRVQQIDFIDIAEVYKALARERYSAAFAAYYRFISRNLAVMLNLEYRPHKVDFGLRYSYRDYPGNEALWIESLLKVHSIQEINKHFEEALQRYRDLAAKHRETYGQSESS